MKWQHPQLGEIGEMRQREQRLKGWKHLYDPLERWEQLMDASLETLHSQARADKCGAWRRPRNGEHPRLGKSCCSCLYRHHDQVWREPYGQALMDPRSRIGKDRFWEGNPTVLASPRGVWLVLRLTGERVFNAFRPHPLGKGVDWEEEDFAAYANRRFERNTGASMRDRIQQLQRQVSRPVDAWHLALAVGAVQADPQPEDGEALRDALARLRSLPERMRREALPAREDLLDALEGVLEGGGEDLDDATEVVLAIEDALVATEVLLGEAEATELHEAVEGLAAWAPQAWLGLQRVVEVRERETVGVAQAWWRTVGEVLGALELGDVQPVHAPEAQLADALTAPRWLERWMGRLSALGQGFAEPRTLGVQVAVAHLGAEADWEVAASGLPPGVQIFIVDAEHPNGEDVTQDANDGGAIWLLEEPGQEACVVRVEGIPPAADLASALERASRTPGSRVTVSLVSRPS